MTATPAASEGRRFAGFIVTGGIAAAVDLASRWGLSFALRFEFAVALAYLVGMTTAFVLARRYVFAGVGNHWTTKYLRFALVNAIGDNRVDLPVWDQARRQLAVADSVRLETQVTGRFFGCRSHPPPPGAAARLHQGHAPSPMGQKRARVPARDRRPAHHRPVGAARRLYRLSRLQLRRVERLYHERPARSAADREHPRKRLRPFAAGTVPVARGVLLSAALMLTAPALATLPPPRFLIVLCSYIVLTLAYSLVLKRQMLVLPLAASEKGMAALLAAIAAEGQASFLTVLKRFGKGSFGLLSFPMQGYTLALDFPANNASFVLLTRLDAITRDHGGRIYLAKDARTDALPAAGYPLLETFRAIRRAHGLDARFSSLQSQRLGL